ncbi:uncharacterized protein LOC129103607 [Anoplopoma fimbria]|uniref:uncharacterized protein LOC129103607 n=1 Tax=Anoplopoma fimbria TaxID=229290 RepID=UPI0023EB5BA0|nr:uncharacterized protein LOC129103607 [Anoplopoma fimbria]XP_054470126.1 uncharacterized protein LOC129103607 [Anoplopoma fimbria]
MPSFDLLNKVELFMRSGTFPVDSSKSSKKVTRAASKHFICKDGCLLRSYRGRLLHVVRSDEEVREILVRYHDNNSHAGRVRMVKEIMLLYYWVGVTEAVKTWIQACAVCRGRTPAVPPARRVQFCLAYGCDASNYVYPQLSFHRFPKDADRRRRWLLLAQRDEGSLRTNSYLCSRHFEPPCFSLSEEGQTTLSPDAVPTVFPVMVKEDEVPVPSDEDFLQSSTLEDLLSRAAAETTDPSELALDLPEPIASLQEHQYCLPGPDPESREVQRVTELKRRKTIIEPSFKAYNQIARYLSHRVLPMQSKTARGGLKRMAKRFGLKDGVLMYTRVSPPVRVPRSREEVNSILQQFHDNQGHYGHGICQREINKHFYWASLTHDLARWISSCHTCLTRTKRKWLRCSVSTCTNCCGPVERGLGLTFHKFPLDNLALLSQWLKAVGRPNWHPRLGSSVCSIHFTEDCFDRSGEKVTVHPDAVPSLCVHGDSATLSRGPTQPAGEEAYFAKYDAVELYLSRHTYPPGLSYVEKNTFRRFCKKFSIKDDELHIVRGDRVRLVLRSRKRVDDALKDYHNELNHLDVSKCLRLLNERYFWKTMRNDVLQWINSCSQCSRRKKPVNQSETRKSPLEAMTSPQIPDDLDSGKDGDDNDQDDDDDEGGGDEERQTETTTQDRVEITVPPEPATPISPQPRIPILLHLRTPIGFQPRTPIILQRGSPNSSFVARLLRIKRGTPPQCEATNSGDTESQSRVQVQEEPTQPQDQKETSGFHGRARTHQYLKIQDKTKPPSESHPPAEPQTQHKLPQATGEQSQPKGQPPRKGRRPATQNRTRSHGNIQLPVKRKRDLEAASSAKRSFSAGLEPVVAPSTKPWPVFTIAGSAPTQPAETIPEVDSSAPCRRPRRLQARTVIQQCSKAKVRIKPELDGADAQWAEVQEGLAVYVCFLHGATEDVAYEMASSLMTTKLFRKDSGHSVSVLDLPGSVLFIPQDSLLGEPVPRRRVQYRGGCELWRGAQLFSILVSACRELMSGSVKCTKAGATVEHGVYGQKQEIVLNSAEPMTLLLEF